MPGGQGMGLWVSGTGSLGLVLKLEMGSEREGPCTMEDPCTMGGDLLNGGLPRGRLPMPEAADWGPRELTGGCPKPYPAHPCVPALVLSVSSFPPGPCPGHAEAAAAAGGGGRTLLWGPGGVAPNSTCSGSQEGCSEPPANTQQMQKHNHKHNKRSLSTGEDDRITNNSWNRQGAKRKPPFLLHKHKHKHKGGVCP